MSKTKLPNVDLTADQIRQMKWYASKKGVKFNTWIRESLLAMLPRDVATLQAREAESEGVKEEAFRQLEQQDEVMGLSLNPANVKAMAPDEMMKPQGHALPIVKEPAPVAAVTKTEGAPVYPPHPCRWLKREFHPFWDASKCQGTCGHPEPKQNSSVCHWPGGAARNCAFFAEFNKRNWQHTVPVGGVRR
jgi:hypothetical protein